MNQTTFDKIILDNLIAKHGADSFGYRNAEGRVYDAYYTNAMFDTFIDTMQIQYPSHYEKFDKGKGSELKPRRNGIIPPKMASVASSSRFCYLALRDGAPHIGVDSVEFEHECRIAQKCGTHPQMDACSLSNQVYVEAKCHEIFAASKETSLGKDYIEYIYGTKDGIGFDLPTEEKPTDRFEIPLKQFGLMRFPMYFDLKQFLCHLWGVASQERDRDKTLLYLFFRPKTEDDKLRTELEAVFDGLRAEIEAVFRSRAVMDFCRANRIALRAVCQYSEVMESLTPSNTQVLY